MSEFVFLFRADEAAQNQSRRSPEQAQATLQKWMTWIKELGAQGHLRNPGQPLDRKGAVVRGSERSITDGPYPEKDVVGGYLVVEAEDIAGAAALAKGCPILEHGGAVEVRPVLQLNL
ncbi:YciI family protein [Geothrix sp. PMB-07]|uniref:YciI family protein n=1 Tax=Geothrix sp. PMB-07 TaxID=3068640 RepID=UPI002741912F|nr:YciI family protein [Geothrix sp. PMB-07]WLT31189.1 YciI family protein [Geothrix sp. PMB-07]